MRGKVFVVEDEAIVARDIAEMLQDLGYEVAGVASNGSEAVDRALSSGANLILMDIRLEGDLDGIAVACAIREREKIPVVFLTAYADDITLERAKDAVPDGYLVKPFAERELHSAIQVALHRARHAGSANGRGSTSDLSTMLEDLGGGSYGLDREWCFTHASPAAKGLFGADRDALVGRCIWELYPELGDSVLRDVFQEVAERGTGTALDAFHLPAQLRVRLRIEPAPDGINVYFVASRAEGV